MTSCPMCDAELVKADVLLDPESDPPLQAADILWYCPQCKRYYEGQHLADPEFLEFCKDMRVGREWSIRLGLPVD